MTIEKRIFGKTKDGKEVDCYILGDSGIVTEILTYGGIVRSINVPAVGGVRDVALGFDDMAGYETQSCYLGATIGRVANRIGGARFTLNGKNHTIEANDGSNCLHGGFHGFDKKIWKARAETEYLALFLSAQAPDCGFPGNLTAEVRYSLKDGSLSIEYIADCDEDTPISLTNHCYFNLGGHDSGSIDSHIIQIFADSITPVDETLIPTGDLLDVADTPFDFREPKTAEAGLSSSHPQIIIGNGFDHNFALSHSPHRDLALAAIVECNGLKMSCHTTQPGVQFYSGNHLSCMNGKGGATYSKRHGFCLETQSWPDAINKPTFPDCVLRKGEKYAHKTTYSFQY